MRISVLTAVAGAICLSLFSVPANAQATRTWVSGVGDDANPCSRTAPCKTFAGAISKTAAGGEINVIDPGGFGSVTITKSIPIIGSGVETGVLVSGTNAIVINAGPTDVVTLQGLDIHGIVPSLSGVKFLSGAELIVKSCRIHGFISSGNGIGLDVDPATRDRVLITDTLIDFNDTGVLVKPTGANVAKVFLERADIYRNLTGGLKVDGPTAEAQLFESVITANAVGITITNGGIVNSFGNNAIFQNGLDGAPPTNTIAPK